MIPDLKSAIVFAPRTVNNEHFTTFSSLHLRALSGRPLPSDICTVAVVALSLHGEMISQMELPQSKTALISRLPLLYTISL